MLREEGRGQGSMNAAQGSRLTKELHRGPCGGLRGPADTLSFGTQEMAYIPGYISDW